MKITLKINEKDKIFIAPFVKARLLRETLALSTKVEKGLDVSTLDDLAEFLVKIYGNQFTADELLDGIAADKFFPKAIDDMQQIVGSFENSIKN